jgi:hypothetical protein
MDIGKIDFCLVRCPSSHDFPCDLHGLLCRAAANDECSNVAKEKRKRINKLPIQIAPCKLSIYQKQVQKNNT